MRNKEVSQNWNWPSRKQGRTTENRNVKWMSWYKIWSDFKQQRKNGINWNSVLKLKIFPNPSLFLKQCFKTQAQQLFRRSKDLRAFQSLNTHFTKTEWWISNRRKTKDGKPKTEKNPRPCKPRRASPISTLLNNLDSLLYMDALSLYSLILLYSRSSLEHRSSKKSCQRRDF